MWNLTIVVHSEHSLMYNILHERKNNSVRIRMSKFYTLKTVWYEVIVVLANVFFCIIGQNNKKATFHSSFHTTHIDSSYNFPQAKRRVLREVQLFRKNT